MFSEDMSSLKVFISSSVYVTIDPGTSSVVASPSCFVELLRCVHSVFFAFSSSRAKEVFYDTPRTCSSAQEKARKNLRLTLKNAFVCFWILER